MSDDYFDYLDQAHATASHAPPSPSRNVERPKIQPADLCAGCIVSLPVKDDFNSGVKCCCTRCPVSEDLEERGYNHPVVVLKIRQATNSNVLGDLVCDVACTTSFSGMSLEQYQNKKRRSPHLHDSIPIIHPGSEGYPGKQLKLEKERKLFKQSYVRLNHIYRIEVAKLRGLLKRAYQLRLDESSYKELTEKLRLAKDKWVDTDTLWETKNQRLLELANSNSRTPQTSRHQTAESSEPVGHNSQQPHRFTSDATPLLRRESIDASPVTPSPARVHHSHLPYHVHEAISTRTTRTPPITSRQQPISYYNPSTWSNTVNTSHISQQNYGTIHPSSRPDRYVHPQRSYVPPRPDPEESGSSWLFIKCVVGFVAVGGLMWWWNTKGKK